MRHPSFFAVVAVLYSLIALGCSGAGGTSRPLTEPNTIDAKADRSGHSTTALFGFYDVNIDIAAKAATVVSNRQAMFTCNVVMFLNPNPQNMTFWINKIIDGNGYIDVDIDVGFRHPFTGLDEFRGYDVRGVFMGDGSKTLNYGDGKLIYPAPGVDQMMLADPVDGYGAPDGYTRWFNFKEFTGTAPLFSYTKGALATPGFQGTATLCPYKYYATGLEKNDGLWNWLSNPANSQNHGVFHAFAVKNERNYYIRFPDDKNLTFGYAVIANWKGTDELNHPANAPEAVAISVVDNSDVYYIDESQKGGSIKLDVSIWNWDASLSGGVMKDYTIKIESTVLDYVYEATTQDMTPVGEGAHYYTYHIEIPANHITGNIGQTYWVIAECTDKTYANDFGVHNDAWDDPLAAFFKFDLIVYADKMPPVAVADANPNPQAECDGVYFSGKDSYDPDGGVIQKYEWDWNNDGAYEEEGAEVFHVWDNPGTYYVQLRVTDDEGMTDTLDTALEITIEPANGWAVTWGGVSEDRCFVVAADEPGNLYVTGYFQDIGVDFDPGAGENIHSSKGNLDAYLSKFNPDGSFAWAKTWGGAESDMARALSIDDTGIYIGGWFSATVDFDPSQEGVTERNTNGFYDCFLSKFDFDGNFLWVQTWGGNDQDHFYCLHADGTGGVYASGAFLSSSIDLDPAGGDTHYSNGSWDCWISKFDSDGAHQWGKSWGGAGDEGVNAIELSGSGNVYCVGNFQGTVNFDPEGTGDSRTAVGWADPWLVCLDTFGTYQWARTWDGSAISSAFDVCNDTAGNVYVSGDFAYSMDGGTIDIDPGPEQDIRYAVGTYDAWLCKLDPSGLFLWGITWGGNWGEGAYSLSTDVSDNIYITGYFRSDSVDFDPGEGSEDIHYNVGMNAEPDIFLMKLDSSGAFDWARTWGSVLQDIGYDVIVRCPSVLYLAGNYYGTVDFNPAGGDSHSAVGGEDDYLMKIRSDGNW